MKTIIAKLKDSYYGDTLVSFSFDGNEHDFIEAMELAMNILYLDYSYSSFEELREDNHKLTRELYDICMDVLYEADSGVTAELFCDFVRRAFGWDAQIVEYTHVINVESGDWD